MTSITDVVRFRHPPFAGLKEPEQATGVYAHLFHALGDGSRLAVLQHLATGEHKVRDPTAAAALIAGAEDLRGANFNMRAAFLDTRNLVSAGKEASRDSCADGDCCASHDE